MSLAEVESLGFQDVESVRGYIDTLSEEDKNHLIEEINKLAVDLFKGSQKVICRS
ncbi:hypothetical protein N9Y92_01960 [Chlamydiales bacterium]|nr:hypothetical protein [Chlamydiales bacterium]